VARFYLDENLPEYLVACLRDLGHDAVSTTQLGRKGQSDPEQLLLAKQLDRVLITFNSDDFRMLHKAWIVWSRAWETRQQHAGILILRQEQPAPRPEEIALIIDQIAGSAGKLTHRVGYGIASSAGERIRHDRHPSSLSQ
jgi:predicted nuclease of predicted toxin-antitoxin system